MNNSRALPLLVLAALCLLGPGCQTGRRTSLTALFPELIHAHTDHTEAAALFDELGGEPAFLDLCRYLYRWHLDEHDFTRFATEHRDQLWLRRVQMVADAQDNSRYLEVVFPAIGVMVTLKKADYRIPELKLAVKSDGYRIIRLCRDTCRQAARRSDFAVLDLDIHTLYERLFELRLETQFPSEALQAHVSADLARRADAPRDAPMTLFFAPVHTVDNELWVFWQEGKQLFRYSSDIDLAEPAAWTHAPLDAAAYDTVTQTVVSFEEAPGDNRFVTRDQVGRALYNCMILGRRRDHVH